jgi:hypothetical protein
LHFYTIQNSDFSLFRAKTTPFSGHFVHNRMAISAGCTKFSPNSPTLDFSPVNGNNWSKRVVFLLKSTVVFQYLGAICEKIDSLSQKRRRTHPPDFPSLERLSRRQKDGVFCANRPKSAPLHSVDNVQLCGYNTQSYNLHPRKRAPQHPTLGTEEITHRAVFWQAREILHKFAKTTQTNRVLQAQKGRIYG